VDCLPDGSFIQIDGSAFLVWSRALYLWSPEAYTRKDRLPQGAMVTVLTPRPIVECLWRGYTAEVHKSAAAI
jgi:hypothetical protein